MGSGCGSVGIDELLPIPEVRGSNQVIGKIQLYTGHIHCSMLKRQN